MQADRASLLAALVLGGVVAGCGGGGGSSPNAAFCQSWATAFCQKLASCDPGQLGGSQAQCASSFAQVCTQGPPQGTTFDVDCAGGAHVDPTAKTACFNELATISCDDFNSPYYVSVCDRVCGGGSADAGGREAGSGGAGGGSVAGAGGGTATGGSGGAATGGSSGATGGSGGAAGSGGGAGASGGSGGGLAGASGGTGGVGGKIGSTGGAGGAPGTGGSAGAGGGGGTGGVGGKIGSTGGAGGSGGTAGTGGTAGQNLIVNGDFSNSVTDWKIVLDAGSLTNSGILNGQLCVTFGAYTTVTLGWPSDTTTVFALQAGATYRLSYQADTTMGLAGFEAQVGQGVAPYTQIDFMTQADVPGSQLDTFTHMFTASVAEPQGGFAFNIISGASAGTVVCVDNVSLTAVN